MCWKAVRLGFLTEDEALDVIGSGTFGVIRKVKRKSDGQLFARKELNFERMNERDRKHIVSEVNILRTLHHDNVVRYEERYVDTENGILYIVMELCEGGDLGCVIQKCRRTKTHLPEETVWFFFAQMAAALEACHYRTQAHAPPGTRSAMQAILHRDLKPENVFLDADQNIKLGDFGLSKQIASQAFASTYVGTPYYMSPELATGQPYDIKSDVWALGCIVYELCALSPPFDAANQAELTRKIKQGLIPALPRMYSREMQEAVHAMLQLDHRRRPTARQLLHLRQIKLAQRTHELAKLHKKVQQDKERVQAQALELQAREALLEAREREYQEALAAASSPASSLQETWQQRDAELQQRETQLQEREAQLQVHEASVRRREEACDEYRQELYRQYCRDKEQLEATLAQQRRTQDDKRAGLTGESLRVSLRRSRRVSTVVGDEAGSSSSQHAADEGWVDVDAPGPSRPSAGPVRTQSAPSVPVHLDLSRLRLQDVDVSDCSMRDASCMWRKALPLRAESSPAKAKRLSLPTTVAEITTAKPAPAPAPAPTTAMQELPKDPQWMLLDEADRPSPFLKRVTRVPLEALATDPAEADDEPEVLLVPGPSKPRPSQARVIAGADEQENATMRRRALLDPRRRRTSLLRPADVRTTLSSGLPRPDVGVRPRPSALPSHVTRPVRPLYSAPRAR